MAKNPFFKHKRSEQDLVNSLTVESIKIHGYDMVYIPRTLVQEDKIFGEDVLSKFEEGNTIEMYIESVDGFEGEGDFISKFGLEIKDTISLVVSRTRFEEVMSHDGNIIRPREGDLVYFPFSRGLFEIKFVEHENPFYQQGKLYTYKLSCELFTYSQETIDTGYSDVDSVEDTRKQYAQELTLGDVYSTPKAFNVGEIVFQVDGVSGAGALLANATATGIVTAWNQDTKLLTITAVDGTLVTTEGASVKGSTSTTEYNLTSVAGTTMIIPAQGSTGGGGQPQGDNEDIEFEIDLNNVFDMSDIDPFSEGNF